MFQSRSNDLAVGAGDHGGADEAVEEFRPALAYQNFAAFGIEKQAKSVAGAGDDVVEVPLDRVGTALVVGEGGEFR